MRNFIPAASVHRLTPAYDTLCRAIGLGRRFRAFELGEVLRGRPRRVLEVGCGTGELLVEILRSPESVSVTGVDVDGAALGIAARKVAEQGAGTPRLVVAPADELPFADAAFDLVVASLMVHHLPTAVKRSAFREWRRVARGGEVLVFDFGPPRSRLGRALTWPLGLNLLEESGDNFAGRIPSMLGDAGLRMTREVATYGRIVHAWRAVA